MCPDPTKGKFILNSQLNFTSTPLSLMPLLLMSQLQWLNANCCYPVPIVSWCSLMTCDVMFPGVMIPWCLLPHVTTDVRTQDPSLPLSCLPAYSLATYWCQGRRCGEDWLLNVITRALSLMSAISRSASAQYLSMFEQNSAVFLFHVAAERDNKKKQEDIVIKWINLLKRNLV